MIRRMVTCPSCSANADAKGRVRCMTREVGPTLYVHDASPSMREGGEANVLTQFRAYGKAFALASSVGLTDGDDTNEGGQVGV